jgi:hypothetical protein
MDQVEVSRFKNPQQIARSQQRAFEWKPWQPGYPLKDVLGNSLCYRDEGAHVDARYWVPMEGERGAHIRLGISLSRFDALAITQAEAEAIAQKYAQHKRMTYRAEASYQRQDGYYIVRAIFNG